MKRTWLLCISALVAGVFFGACGGGGTEGTTEGPVEFANDVDEYSYAIGVQVGENIKSTGCELNVPMILRGVDDVMSDRPLALEATERQQAMMNFQKTIAQIRKAETEKALDESKAFFEENSTAEGVVTLPSGLQYKVLQQGTGPRPRATDTVKVNYRGTLLDGTEFDSSYKRGEPARFQVNRVIRGWKEGLQLMNEGALWQLFIPPNLAYGERGAGRSIPPNSALVFDVELLEIVKPPTKTEGPEAEPQE